MHGECAFVQLLSGMGWEKSLSRLRLRLCFVGLGGGKQLRCSVLCRYFSCFFYFHYYFYFYFLSFFFFCFIFSILIIMYCCCPRLLYLLLIIVLSL